MNIISVTDITKTYTERKLFEKASFYLQEREKVGVIGINGTGKSPLLKNTRNIIKLESFYVNYCIFFCIFLQNENMIRTASDNRRSKGRNRRYL